jgi:hypothetical protein
MQQSRGGVKKKYPEKQGIKPIIDMLIKGKVKLLSNSSLSGIIFQLTVDEADSEYMDILDGKFVIPVTDYVFKISCIDTGNKSIYYKFSGNTKKSESKNNFLKESRLQQKIWMESISGGRPALCPSVVDVLFFDRDNNIVGVSGYESSSNSEESEENTSSSEISDSSSEISDSSSEISDWTDYDSSEINSLVREELENEYDDDEDEDADNGIEYPGKSFLKLFSKNLVGNEKKIMVNLVNKFGEVFENRPELEMGIIVMPMINNSSTLYNALLHKGDPIIQSNIKSSIIAKSIRLFIDIGVIHMDLHRSNALVYRNRDGLIDTTIIDFGRASDITNGVSDKYFDKTIKAQFMKKKNDFLNELENLDLTSPNSEKRRYIREVVNFVEMNIMTSAKFNILNDMSDIFFYLTNNTQIGLDAFDILKSTIKQHQIIDPVTLATHSVLPFEEIDQFCTEGCIYPTNKPIASHYIPKSILEEFSQKEPAIILSKEKRLERKEREKTIRKEIKKKEKLRDIADKIDVLEDRLVDASPTESRRIFKKVKELKRKIRTIKNINQPPPPPQPPLKEDSPLLTTPPQPPQPPLKEDSPLLTTPPQPPQPPLKEDSPLIPTTPPGKEIRKPVKTKCEGPMCVVMGGKRRTKKRTKRLTKRLTKRRTKR